MEITMERWQTAQTEEFGHHQDLRPEAYSVGSNVIGKYLGIDYLKDFTELNEYEIYAGDGHFIQHACHTAISDPKKEQRRTGKLPKLHAAGLIYMQNLHKFEQK